MDLLKKKLEQNCILAFIENLLTYDFRDDHGHPLKNCIDFHELIKNSLRLNIKYLETERFFYTCLNEKNLINKKIEELEKALNSY